MATCLEDERALQRKSQLLFVFVSFFSIYLTGAERSSLSKSKFLAGTLELEEAFSISVSPICSYRYCTSLMTLPVRAEPLLPLTVFSKDHTAGNTWSSTCFCLREQVSAMRSASLQTSWGLMRVLACIARLVKGCIS